MASKFKSWIQNRNRFENENLVSCKDCGIVLDKTFASFVTDRSKDRNPQYYYCDTHKKKYDAYDSWVSGKRDYYLYVGFIPCDENGKIDVNSDEFKAYKMKEFLADKGLKVVGAAE